MGGKHKSYSVNCKDYELHEEVGHGASATVYRAIYIPSSDVVAVKCLDLDRCNCNLDDIRREAQTMILIDHPNVINAHCSFVVGHSLWVVMPFMAEGSCLHLMQIARSDGFEESVIGSILKETLRALEYLHGHGHIHRDVKAGNILLHSNGEVKLADFGVSACMFDRGDRQYSRNTFVGTPCWMAPEVLQPGNGYDFKADIWSFGITALELAHGHAPFSKYPPMKVLLMTIQNAPPGLDYDRDKKFSKSFKEMVAMCLVKDQTKRPTATKLLKHSFFKNVKPPELSVKRLFADLPPLWNRVKSLQLKDAAEVALKRMPSGEQEALSQSEYQRGVSAWNFNIEDIKLQASVLQQENEEDCTNDANTKWQDPSNSEAVVGKSIFKNVIHSEQMNGNVLENDIMDPEYPEKLELRKNGSKPELPPPVSDKDSLITNTRTQTGRTHQAQSGLLAPGQVVGQSISTCNLDRSEIENHLPDGKASKVRKAPSSSGPLMLPRRASANSLSAPVKSSGGFGESLDDKSMANMVQIRGRFSITSGNLDLVKPMSQTTKDIFKSNVPASSLMPHLQNLFQQTSIQQDLIMNLLNSLQPVEVPDASLNCKLPPVHPISENNGNDDGATSERERLLLQKISVLQARMNNLTDELTTEKLKYTQLQQQMINATSGHEVEGHRRLEDC